MGEKEGKAEAPAWMHGGLEEEHKHSRGRCPCPVVDAAQVWLLGMLLSVEFRIVVEFVVVSIEPVFHACPSTPQET